MSTATETKKYEPKIYVLTGAGISAPSGISTWRANDNAHENPIEGSDVTEKKPIWERYDKDVVCNYRAWKKRRSMVFKFYKEMTELYGNAKPNGAHKFFAKLQKQYGAKRVKIITQNVDHLLEDAGCTEVLHLHGEGGKLVCKKCKITWTDDVEEDVECGLCGSCANVKPAVVFFGEDAPNYRVFGHYFNKLRKEDIVIICGTNGQVVNLEHHCNGDVMYNEANYILNVYDEEQHHKIPDDERLYGVECCTTFLPKVKGYIDAHMSLV